MLTPRCSFAATGLFLGYTMHDQGFSVASVVLALPLGLLGVAPLGHAAVALYTQDTQRFMRLISYAKCIELVFETVPQSSLQTFVAVVDDRLDPSNPSNVKLLLSIAPGLHNFGGQNRVSRPRKRRSSLFLLN